MKPSTVNSKGPWLTIVRGLPGSGKSTKALELYQQGAGLLIEPDACLMNNGTYTYTKERMNTAVYVLLHGHTLRNIAWPFICGTTNNYEEMKIPIIYADVLPSIESVFEVIGGCSMTLYPERVKVIDCSITMEESIKRNIHNVRVEDIQRMAQEWRPWSIVQQEGYKYHDWTFPPKAFDCE